MGEAERDLSLRTHTPSGFASTSAATQERIEAHRLEVEQQGSRMT